MALKSKFYIDDLVRLKRKNNSVIARVRSIEKTRIIVEWFNSTGDLIGTYASEDNIELFERKTQLDCFKNSLQKLSIKLILIALFVSLFSNGIYTSYKILIDRRLKCLEDNLRSYWPSKCDENVSLWKAFLFTFEDLTIKLSSLCGSTLKEFIASLFSGFNYLEQLLLIIGVFKTIYSLIISFLKIK